MEPKYIISIIIVIAIIIAIILKDKIKASFMGMRLNAENRAKKNNLKIDGDENKVKQGNSSRTSQANNTAGINGNKNEVEQN